MGSFKQQFAEEAEARRRRAQLEAQPCACVMCQECHGTGEVYFSFEDGRYLKRSHWDDLDDVEVCEECGGSGVVETCDRCSELHELDEMENRLSVVIV